MKGCRVRDAAGDRLLFSTRLAALSFGLVTAAPAQQAAAPRQVRDRPPEDEVIYLVMPDRFANGDPGNDRAGLAGDRLKTGYDPTAKGFYTVAT